MSVSARPATRSRHFARTVGVFVGVSVFTSALLALLFGLTAQSIGLLDWVWVVGAVIAFLAPGGLLSAIALAGLNRRVARPTPRQAAALAATLSGLAAGLMAAVVNATPGDPTDLTTAIVASVLLGSVTGGVAGAIAAALDKPSMNAVPDTGPAA